MEVITCKMCGGDLTLTPGSNLAVVNIVVPGRRVRLSMMIKKVRLYNRANRYRLECEFDKTYENIVSDGPAEAEAY